MPDRYKVAVAGATGAVGQQMLAILAQRRFPVGELVALASPRSAGRPLLFDGREVRVQALDEGSFEGVDLALFSAGGAASIRFAPAAAAAGATVVDNSSAFRMDDDVPLVVPEGNPEAALDAPRGIISNPNCSTIQMVVVLEPLRRAAGIERIVVATYQAVSGAGFSALNELNEQLAAAGDRPPLPPPKVFPYQILGECLPQIGDLLPDGDSTEERKMVNETRKILGEPDLRVSATTVRVAVLCAHSEAVNVELRGPLSPDEARRLLGEAPGVEVVDDPVAQRYPLARQASGTDPVYVGRIRRDASVPHGLNLWVVADNLRKGAALNAIQIAEVLHERGKLGSR